VTAVLLDGLGIPESLRWHDGRLWFCNWTTGDVVAIGADATSEIVAHVPTTIPYSIDWLPDGTLLIVSGQEGLVLRQQPDGSLVTHADVTRFGIVNEIVVDGEGNAFVNGEVVLLVRPNGSVQQVADGIAFGNGMALLPDGRTLIVAESHANRLTAFTVEADATLSHRRVWAELDAAPDGICVDADGAIWSASVPGRHCVRVREGGEVAQTVEADRGAFACTLGGADGRTLYIGTAEWHGMDAMFGTVATGQLVTERVAVPHAGRP